jgi:1-acyl-sn-glycerol-3-phosphate acyltransferase
MLTFIFFAFWFIFIFWQNPKKMPIDFYFYQKFLINFILGSLLAFLMTFLILIFCLIVMIFLPANHYFKGFVSRSVSRFINFFLRIEVVVQNTHLIPLKENVVIYANHKSYMDPFVMASVIPMTLSFAPKQNFNCFFGTAWFLKLVFLSLDCMVISRDNIRKTAQNLIKAVPKVQNGMTMVVFPEGGIKDRNNEKAISFLGGAFKIAYKSKALILPLTIKGTTQIKNKYFWQKKVIEVIIHPHLKYDNYRNKNIHQLSLDVQRIINSSFN